MSVRQAQLVATTLNVLCPYCGEPQPNPDDGSEQWETRQVERANETGAKDCVSCERKFRVFPRSRVEVSP